MSFVDHSSSAKCSRSKNSSISSKKQQFRSSIRKEKLQGIFASKRKQYFADRPTTVSHSSEFKQERIDDQVPVSEQQACLDNDPNVRQVLSSQIGNVEIKQNEQLPVINQNQQVDAMNIGQSFANNIGNVSPKQFGNSQPENLPRQHYVDKYIANQFSISNNVETSLNIPFQQLNYQHDQQNHFIPYFNQPYPNFNQPSFQSPPLFPQYNPQTSFNQPPHQFNHPNPQFNQLDITFMANQNNNFQLSTEGNNQSIFYSSPIPYSSPIHNQQFSPILNYLSSPQPQHRQIKKFDQFMRPNQQMSPNRQIEELFHMADNLLSNGRILDRPNYVDTFFKVVQQRNNYAQQRQKLQMLLPDHQHQPYQMDIQYPQINLQPHIDRIVQHRVTPSVSPFTRHRNKPQINRPLIIEFKQQNFPVQVKQKKPKFDMKNIMERMREKENKKNQEQRCQKEREMQQNKKINHERNNNIVNQQHHPKSSCLKNHAFQQPTHISKPYVEQNKQFITRIVTQQKLTVNQKLNLLKIIDCGYQIVKHYNEFIMLNKVLGKGAFGAVYQGLNFTSNEKVAVKKIQVKKIKHLIEVECLKEINHKNIIMLHDHLIDDKEKECFLFLEYCQENLRQRMDRIKQPVGKEAGQVKIKISYAEQLIEGMNQLNEKGFIHRDLKFQNILIKDENVIKICDFGLCRKVNKKLQVDSVRCGTPYTMSPEIYFHPKNQEENPTYTEKADIFSLAVILHQLLYSFHPFDYEEDKLKSLERIQQDKAKKMFKRFVQEYRLNVQWIEEIIEGGLKSVHERMTWKDVMQTFGRRSLKEQVQKELKDVSRNFTKKKSNQIVLAQSNINLLKKPVIQPRLHNINHPLLFQPVKKFAKKQQIKITSNKINNQQNREQKQVDLVSQAKKIFSNKNIINQKQPKINKVKDLNISFIRNNNKKVQQTNIDLLYQKNEIDGFKRLKEFRPEIYQDEEKEKALVNVNNYALNVQPKTIVVKKKVITKNVTEVNQYSLKKLFILLLFVVVFLLVSSILFAKKELVPLEVNKLQILSQTS